MYALRSGIDAPPPAIIFKKNIYSVHSYANPLVYFMKNFQTEHSFVFKKTSQFSLDCSRFDHDIEYF